MRRMRAPTFRVVGIAAFALLLLFCGRAEATATAAPCSVHRGSIAGLLIEAIVLTPDGIEPHGSVRVGADGRIACVGVACRLHAGDVSVIRCPADVLSPGLINTHDHIDFTGVAPRPDTGERFAHRHEWRLGLDGHHQLQNFIGDPDTRVIAWGELRFLVGGTTSTVGGDMAPGLLRNLDVAAGLEGLPVRPVTYRVFPLDDAAGIMRTTDCDYGAHPASHDQVLQTSAFLAHVAEGTNAAARNEFRCESSLTYDVTPQPGGGGTSNDWIMPQATLIHAVALTPDDLALVAARGAAIVWSPRSNLALYGRTLDVVEAKRHGIPLALGSDWLPSGSMNLNRELACAQHYNRTVLHAALSDVDLWRMVTSGAARAAHVETQIGSIAPGFIADLALFTPQSPNAYAAVVDATPQSVAVVVRGGTVLYGDPAIVDRLRPACDRFTVAGVPKRLCYEPKRLSAEALQTFARTRNLYPLAFAGTPRNEPPCEPSKAVQSP
jgi:cytosine/adenosine deaminase-related metal-dependent hydrolase